MNCWLRLVLTGLSACRVAGLTVLILAGCGKSQTDPSDESSRLPFAGTQITARVPQGHGLADAWGVLADEWSAQTRAECRVRDYRLNRSNGPVESFHDLLQPDAGELPAKSAEVWLFPITQVAALDTAGALAPIPERLQSAERLNWLDVLPGLRQTVASPRGRPTVLPVASPVLVLYYRRDLLRQAGLSPPRTWGEYQQLLEKMNEWAPEMTAVEPWSPRFRATMFLSRAVAYAQHPGNFSLFFDMETGQPLIDTPGFVRALKASREAVKHMPEEVLDYSPADCRQAVLAGEVALAITFETGTNRPPLLPPLLAGRQNDAAETATSKNQDRLSRGGKRESMQIGFARLPGSPKVYNNATSRWEAPPNEGINRTTLTAFAGLCLGVRADSGKKPKQAAWNLVTRLNQQWRQAFPKGTRTPCRESHLSAPGDWVGVELPAGEANGYVQTVGASLRGQDVVAELPVAGRQQFRAALTAGLNQVLKGEGSAESALQKVARRWKKILEEIGVKTVRASYRHSLGLPTLQ